MSRVYRWVSPLTTRTALLGVWFGASKARLPRSWYLLQRSQQYRIWSRKLQLLGKSRCLESNE